MTESRKGDILKADAEALVNTVNCVGVMGRGIALQFRNAFPENYREYVAACKREEVQPGRMLVHDRNTLTNPRYIINFPTKTHWKGKSRLEYIRSGLEALRQEVRRLDIRSIAIPPLGAGLGGLDWKVVRPLIESAFEDMPDVDVLIFDPTGAPVPQEMAKSAKAPNMTTGRAALLELMDRYLAALIDPFVTLLELHKLMYFMQEAGEPLRLHYSKGPYGPFAENLSHVLKAIDGYFIEGYGDGDDKPDKEIEPKGDVITEARTFLIDHHETRKHFDRVAELIDGFETRYGMELLSTVHWVATREGAGTPEAAIESVYAWNDRKRRFVPEHIRLAWSVLTEKAWIG